MTDPEIARRNALVEEWMWLATAIAKSVMKRLPPCFEFQDLRQAGCMGLLDAATKYDESRGVPFRCYAALRIHGEILESARRRSWKESTHLPITTEVLELPGHGAESIEHSIEHAQKARIIAEAKEGLTPTERDVIEIYFHQDGKLSGIGEALGVRQSRSSQVLQMAKRSMERELRWRGLVVDEETGCTASEMSDAAYEARANKRRGKCA